MDSGYLGLLPSWQSPASQEYKTNLLRCDSQKKNMAQAPPWTIMGCRNHPVLGSGKSGLPQCPYTLVPKITYHSAPLSAAVTCCTTLLSARNYSLTQLLIFMVILAVLVLQVIWLYPQMPGGRAHPSCRCVKRQAYYEAASSSPLCPE